MYPISLDLTDSDMTFPGYLYLPGESVPEADRVDCCYCAESMRQAGSADIATGGTVDQHPGAGDHDGIVSGIYAPMVGARAMESDYSHLRCVLESCEMGSTRMTVLLGDPYAVANVRPYISRHAA